MSKIRILPEQLANQIAAGEVVERPASVVKELVENSLDAKARRIVIEIEGGGTRLIRVIDDGEGMKEDDLLMSLERHGTSKISTEEDLAEIVTLGFRGEAVPSIGSVSQLTITSRVADAELGTRIILNYGKLTKVYETGCTIGTCFEVRRLFGNTPARRKFLRTARTEIGHIDDVVKNYALGAPDVTFILRIDGRETLYLDNTLSAEQRLGVVLRYEDTFISVDGKERSGESLRRISGYLIPPDKVTIGPSKLRLFVNGRVVKDRMIIHGVTEGLRSFLMKGKNPAGLINIVVPPSEVDVNVHPAKLEVRFRNSRDVHTLISRSISQAILDYQQTIKASIFGKDQRIISSPIPMESERFSPPSPESPPITSELYGAKEIVRQDSEPARRDSREAEVPQTQKIPTTKETVSQPLFETTSALPHTVKDVRTEEPGHRPSTPATTTEHNLLVIGQFDDLYIFCKNSEGLLVIDQHAAHERILYEKLRKQYLDKTIIRQTLMFPETVELSLFQTKLVEKSGEELDRMGFTIREFGGSTFIISAIPALAGQTNPRELFLDILEQFGSETLGNQKGGFLDTILATMACKAAVKAGTRLSDKEIDNLLNEMARADLFSHCPHGRPVVKQFNKNEVKKWFHRT